ncbi:MAG: hypothetical protein JSU99_07195, partial [Nitrospiraceae bacterium]
FLDTPKLGEDDIETVMGQIIKVFNSRQKLYARFTRKGLRDGSIYSHYPFESDGGDGIIEKSLAGLEEILSRPVNSLEEDVQKKILEEVPGILSQ